MSPVEDGPVADGFTLHLDNFEGPFDLLLQLIAKHELDVTEVALARVTDEFIGYLTAAEQDRDLDTISHFLVVAATLLDLKAARLLPGGEVETEEDLALLEARDLLFARLLQYRAFKQISLVLADSMIAEERRFARPGGLEPGFSLLLPEVLIPVRPDQLAALAAAAMAPRTAAEVSLTHLHAPRMSVREQADILVDRLRRRRTLSFRALVADATDRISIVCRFLALLELFRERAVTFEQATPLGELFVHWTGTESGSFAISAEFDDVAPEPEAVDVRREFL